MCVHKYEYIHKQYMHIFIYIHIIVAAIIHTIYYHATAAEHFASIFLYPEQGLYVYLHTSALVPQFLRQRSET